MVQGYVIRAEGFQVRFERLAEGVLLEVMFDADADSERDANLFRDTLTGQQTKALGQWLLEPE